MATETDTQDSGRRLTPQRALATAGVVLATVALGVAVGPPGVALALAVGLAQYFFSSPVAFAVGQVVLVALFPENGAMLPLTLCEVGLITVLISPAAEHDAPLRTVLATLLAGAVLGLVAWAGLASTEGLWAGAVALGGGVAIGAYGLHRYELVRLNLLAS
jgi:hypothetical protein